MLGEGGADLGDRSSVLLDERMVPDSFEGDSPDVWQTLLQELRAGGKRRVAGPVNDQNRTRDPAQLVAEIGLERDPFERRCVVVVREDFACRDVGAPTATAPPGARP
jgi:hypothetical protein